MCAESAITRLPLEVAPAVTLLLRADLQRRHRDTFTSQPVESLATPGFAPGHSNQQSPSDTFTVTFGTLLLFSTREHQGNRRTHAQPITGQPHHRRANHIHHVRHGRDARPACGSDQDATARRIQTTRGRDEIASQSAQVEVSHSERRHEEGDWPNDGTRLLCPTPLLAPAMLAETTKPSSMAFGAIRKDRTQLKTRYAGEARRSKPDRDLGCRPDE